MLDEQKKENEILKKENGSLKKQIKEMGGEVRTDLLLTTASTKLDSEIDSKRDTEILLDDDDENGSADSAILISSPVKNASPDKKISPGKNESADKNDLALSDSSIRSLQSKLRHESVSTQTDIVEN